MFSEHDAWLSPETSFSFQLTPLCGQSPFNVQNTLKPVFPVISLVIVKGLCLGPAYIYLERF